MDFELFLSYLKIKWEHGWYDDVIVKLKDMTLELTPEEYERLLDHALKFNSPHRPTRSQWEPWIDWVKTVTRDELANKTMNMFNASIDSVQDHPLVKKMNEELSNAEPIGWEDGLVDFLNSLDAKDAVDAMSKIKNKGQV